VTIGPLDVSAAGIRALHAIYAHYHEQDAFPGLSDLRRALLASDDASDEAAAEELDRLSGRFVRKDHDRSGPIRLSVTGMYVAAGRCVELQDFIGLLRICQGRFKQNDAPRVIPAADVRKELGLDESREIRLQALVERWEFVLGPSGNDQQGWSWEVSDGIVDYRKVRTIEEFIEVYEARHPDRLETPYTYLPSAVDYLERTRPRPQPDHDSRRLELPFIRHANLRAIAERNYADLTALLTADGQLVAKVVLAGAIVEAILLDDIVDDGAIVPEQLLALPLGGLVKEARRAGAKVSQRVTKLADVAKDYRNLGHPGRELKEGQLSKEDADVATALMNALIAERRVLGHTRSQR